MPIRDDLIVSLAALTQVQPLRDMYREEMAAQIVHDSWHARGFTDLYACHHRGRLIGYAAVGGAPGDPRDTVKELFLLPPSRGLALDVFDRLVPLSGATAIEAQTNDRLLSLVCFDRARDWHVTHVLFSDNLTTHHAAPAGVVLRAVTEADRATVFAHRHEPVGDWGLACGSELVATGGVLEHYNPPYGDVYMEVSAAHRRRGYGSYLVQELARLCREQGGIPAARCRPDNIASRRTLTAAGLVPCAQILRGTIRS